MRRRWRAPHDEHRPFISEASPRTRSFAPQAQAKDVYTPATLFFEAKRSVDLVSFDYTPGCALNEAESVKVLCINISMNTHVSIPCIYQPLDEEFIPSCRAGAEPDPGFCTHRFCRRV